MAWLEAEREARVVPPPEPVIIGPLTLQLGAMNQVALPAEGALLRFVPADSGTGGRISRVSVLAVTANFFQVLGVSAQMGRPFSAHESAVLGA